MGKKTVRLDEMIHDEIEEIQVEWMKKTGEDPPSKEKIIEKSVEETHPDQILSDLFLENKKKERKDVDDTTTSSTFDDYFF